MTFTDENGEKFEEVELRGERTFVIRPIKPEPKWLIHETDKNFIKIELFGDAIEQAQLIKEAVEALMGQIFSDTDRLVLIEAINKARKGLQT